MEFTPRAIDLTNYTQFPTDPPSEDNIRQDLEDAFQEVFDNVTNPLIATTDGASGMDLVGMTPIDGVMTTPQQALEYLKGRIDATQPTLNIVSVLDYGTVGDGVEDDAPKVQNAIDYLAFLGGGVLWFDGSKIYKFKSTVLLIDDIIVLGNGATILGEMIVAGSGNKPLTLVKGTGVTNIIINNINFNGSYNGETIVGTTVANEVSNVLEFTNVNNLIINDCSLFNVGGNWWALHEVDFCAVGIDTCADIRLKNFFFNDFTTEGIVFDTSENIKIDGIKVTSLSSGWTPLHFWYCDGISVENVDINIKTDSGTGINGAYKNANFSNIKITGGKGIQFSNELDRIPFKSENIILSKLNLDVKAFGVLQIPNSNHIDVENIIVKDSFIKVNDDSLSTSNNVGVRFSGGSNIEIENIMFELPDLSSFALNLANLQKVTISECKGNINAFAYISLNDESINDLKIINCSLQMLPNDGNTFTNGRGCFIFAQHDATALTTLAELNNFECHGNTVNGIEGAVFYTLFNELTNVMCNDIFIHDNYFKSTDATLIQSGFNIRNMKNLKLVNNTIINVARQFVTDIEDLEILNNYIELETGLANTGAIWQINGCSGVGLIKRNTAKNRNTSFNHFFSNVANAFGSYEFEKNFDQNSTGIINTATGTTAQRPIARYINQIYYDSTLSKNIWWNGTVWKDGIGTTV